MLNRCDHPPWVIGSCAFNDDPSPIEIQDVRRSNRFLFGILDTLATRGARSEAFADYMSVVFSLHKIEEQTSSKAARSIRNSYLRFLRGWGADSNSIEGAVLKGWVESRIGLPPTFHKERIDSLSSETYTGYMIDLMKGCLYTNAINRQLDLLFAFTQYELARSFDDRWIILYRGTHDASEYEVLESLDKRNSIVRLNSLNSFTGDVERAWEFGSTVWEVKVPVCKIFHYGGLLPGSILKGESEYMVIGGEYRVKRLLA